MRILLSNDDGVEAPGLWALYEAIRRIPDADVTVVAPSTERSAAGHSISVFGELTLRKHSRNGVEWAYSLDGTPADCVKMGLFHLMRGAHPELVISGVNRGQNTGTSILYSGTVAAAREATMAGIPAIAVSLALILPSGPASGLDVPPEVAALGTLPAKATGDMGDDAVAVPAGEPDKMMPAPKDLARRAEEYAAAAEFTASLARTVLKRGLPKGTLLNVNVPLLPRKVLKGPVVSKMGHSVFIDQFKAMRESPSSIAFRNIGSELMPSPEGDEWDDLVLQRGQISVSPLHYDLTHHHFLDQLRAWVTEEQRETAEAGAAVADALAEDLGAEIS